VVFNGERGETHPHTWEFSALLISTTDSITKFTDTEKAIEKIFAPYQNKVLNELEPFNDFVPSLENMTEYFVRRISEVVKPFGYRLQEFEGSETPVRTYGVLIEDGDRNTLKSVNVKSDERVTTKMDPETEAKYVDSILEAMEKEKNE
jgi:6-pyruvoyltetrahydropterin/6-carboxytetrahydropterin synthase